MYESFVTSQTSPRESCLKEGTPKTGVDVLDDRHTKYPAWAINRLAINDDQGQEKVREVDSSHGFINVTVTRSVT